MRFMCRGGTAFSCFPTNNIPQLAYSNLVALSNEYACQMLVHSV